MQAKTDNLIGSTGAQFPTSTMPAPGLPGHCRNGHEWVVFSTAVKDVCLMVQCVQCGAFGTVDDPDEQEWSEAFHAPTDPYGWDDYSRVTVRGSGPLYVQRHSDDWSEHDPSTQAEGTVA